MSQSKSVDSGNDRLCVCDEIRAQAAAMRMRKGLSINDSPPYLNFMAEST